MTVEPRLRALLDDVAPADAAAAAAARARLDALAKPPGSLGRLEELAVRLAGIAGACPPPVPRSPAVVVAVGDHGVHARGVTPWPQSITATMVGLLCEGRASVNALAAAVGAAVSVLDVGVAAEVRDHPRLRRARVRAGTDDLTVGDAMTREEAARAVLAGAGLAEELVAGGADLLVTGDMGIANTTAAACLVAAFTGADPAAVTGPGAGADAAVLERKRAAVRAGLERAGLAGDASGAARDPLGALAAVGGLEHAALVGVILSGAADRIPVLLDGVNADAAALVAVALAPAAAGTLVAGHRSTEPGAGAALDALGLAPLLDLDLRLGEGTGAVLAAPLAVAAARLLHDVATLDEVAP